jgi:hypothetical protein
MFDTAITVLHSQQLRNIWKAEGKRESKKKQISSGIFNLKYAALLRKHEKNLPPLSLLLWWCCVALLLLRCCLIPQAASSNKQTAEAVP